MRKYQNLLERHMTARRKYFELFFRADPRQKAKLERLYDQSRNDLRAFEDTLTPEDRERWQQTVHGNRVDNTYSENHELAFEAEPVKAVGDFEDPHFLNTQQESDFRDDDEESTGSMDDYNSYKS